MRSGAYTTLTQYLTEQYEQGFIGTMYSLQRQGIPLAFPIDQASMARAVSMTADDVKLSKRVYDNVGKLQKQVIGEITRGFADGSHVTDIAKNIVADTDIAAEIKRNVAGRTDQACRRSMTIARTEKGRVRSVSSMEAALKANANGADIVKQWDSTMDGRIRPDHVNADGQIKELEEPFVVGGNKGMSPHQFGVPWEDINCRCVALKRARAALEWDDKSTKWNGTSQCYVDISDAKNYSEFKERYDGICVQARKNAGLSDTLWVNNTVSSLESPSDVKRYLDKKHGIQAMESFSELPLETQKSAVAGIDAAVGRYGVADAQHIKLIAGSSRDDGQYDVMAGTILLNKNVKDAYIVAYHETIHSIDAKKSSLMPAFVETSGQKAYNLYSAKVLSASCKAIGVSSKSNKFKDMLTEIFEYDPYLVNRYLNNGGEIVAYALDFEESGRSNLLSKAISERF